MPDPMGSGRKWAAQLGACGNFRPAIQIPINEVRKVAGLPLRSLGLQPPSLSVIVDSHSHCVYEAGYLVAGDPTRRYGSFFVKKQPSLTLIFSSEIAHYELITMPAIETSTSLRKHEKKSNPS